MVSTVVVAQTNMKNKKKQDWFLKIITTSNDIIAGNVRKRFKIELKFIAKCVSYR